MRNLLDCVAPQNIGFYIDQISRPPSLPYRGLDRLGYEIYDDFPAPYPRDGKAYSIQGYRAFGKAYGGEPGGQIDMGVDILSAPDNSDQLADAFYMTLYQMAPKPSIESCRPLQVYSRWRPEVADGGLPQGLLKGLEDEAAFGHIHHRLADTVDRYAVADLGVLEDLAGADKESSIPCASKYASNGP